MLVKSEIGPTSGFTKKTRAMKYQEFTKEVFDKAPIGAVYEMTTLQSMELVYAWGHDIAFGGQIMLPPGTFRIKKVKQGHLLADEIFRYGECYLYFNGMAVKCGIGMFDKDKDYVSFREVTKKRVVLLNTSIVTHIGNYDLKEISVEDAVTQCNGAWEVISAIGHQSTADILSNLLDRRVEVNRIVYEQRISDTAIVIKLRGRPQEGKVLTRSEIEEIGYDLYLLTRNR